MALFPEIGAPPPHWQFREFLWVGDEHLMFELRNVEGLYQNLIAEVDPLQGSHSVRRKTWSHVNVDTHMIDSHDRCNCDYIPSLPCDYSEPTMIVSDSSTLAVKQTYLNA